MSSTEELKKQHQSPATPTEKMAWLKRILADDKISLGAKVVATRLTMFHNEETGQCNPRQKALADAVGLERKTVNLRLRELEAGGWITSHQTRGASLYVLNVHRSETEVSGYTDTSRRRVPRKTGQSTDTRCPPAGTAGVTLPGQQVSAGRDTELPTERPKRTIQLNDGAGAHRQQREIEGEAVPDNRKTIQPDNDNGAPSGIAFRGFVLKVTHAKLAELEREFPDLDMRSVLNDLDVAAMQAGAETAEAIQLVAAAVSVRSQAEAKHIAGSQAA